MKNQKQRAAHPANAGDNERRLDRRVMVFRMR